MKILTASQIREADAYTIANEPIPGIDLMERASRACANWIQTHYPPGQPVIVFAGKGNNGGDGLAIARILLEAGYRVHVAIIQHMEHASEDHIMNLTRLKALVNSPVQVVHAVNEMPAIPAGAIIIDAILGTGTNRPVSGWLTNVFHYINNKAKNSTIVSIDMPSGLMADRSTKNAPSVHADFTLSFECYKLAFMLPENADRVGTPVILPIGLHKDYMQHVSTNFHFVDRSIIDTLYLPRSPFSHKGTYGHACIIAGSYGKMGAAVLATRSCLRSGAGLVSAYVPTCGYTILQESIPEAMCITDPAGEFSGSIHDLDQLGITFKAIGIGPGIGMHPSTVKSFERWITLQRQPVVIDADALNIIAGNPSLVQFIPAHSILTPHPKEFERLFGKTTDEFERLGLLSAKAVAWNIYILLKGRFSAIACPDGSIFFNSTGNPGMATGGSGDVLTGILTGLLSQGYQPKAAVLLGAYVHGAAGDAASAHYSQEAMSAGDIIGHLGDVFLSIRESASTNKL
ncbi:bifunctional ADP-dependent NAD(P)H-hydrate dehydratase/NAD(P)H-hydrate epimerase [Chitinophaga caeni]|uniref:Bifunctional NAD(P)H-hydrate repair enzyme n=1 Tax=Chitinophaga caeni TaxID=2029983 RepID=A0A291R1A5_9BACT|nr:NAD(P)H-hydrate dehydratase [Chitinophaga caeni]ATL49980.1 bifunctional ADP-dependent NAD(P)H-hydrate dehydratase/NAD(P)H-hydrate epimerase [Chitinophaga caeni]